MPANVPVVFQNLARPGDDVKLIYALVAYTYSPSSGGGPPEIVDEDWKDNPIPPGGKSAPFYPPSPAKEIAKIEVSARFLVGSRKESDRDDSERTGVAPRMWVGLQPASTWGPDASREPGFRGLWEVRLKPAP